MMKMSVLKMNLWKTKIFTHLTVTESILSRDGTVSEIELLNSDRKTSRNNISRTRPGTKQFNLARVDKALDVFKELWVYQNFEWILWYIKAEALRKENNEFFMANQKEDSSFVKQCQKISFNLFSDIFYLTINISERFAEEQTSLLQFENYGTQ